MKKTLIAINILFVSTCLLGQTKTDPCQTIPYETYKPSIFDWQKHGKNGVPSYSYSSYYMNNNNVTQNVQVKTPYDSEENWNVKDLYETLYTTNLDIDLSTVSGWELVNYRMGSATDPINYPPCIILYNRFQSILRVFAVIPPNLTNKDDGASSYLISIAFHNLRGKSALFSKAEKYIPSVIDFNPNHSLSVVNKYANQINNQWLRADFQVMYDPCTCRNSSQNGSPLMYIFLDKVKTANVNLISKLDGKITGIANGASEDKITAYDDVASIFSTFGRLDGTATGSLSLSGSGSISTKRNDLGTKVLKKQSAKYRSTQTTTCKSSPEYQDAIGSVAAVGSLAFGGEVTVALQAVGMLSSFFSSSSNSNSNSDVYSERSDSQISATVTTTGTIESQELGMYYTVMLPGSNHITADPTTNINAPFYDNTLGVFNLAYTPTVEIVEYNAPKYSDTYKCQPVNHSCSSRNNTWYYEADVDFQFPKIREYRLKKMKI